MTRKNNAFTLVEILIVVIILGILAAIVIPQFTGAADDAQDSRVSTDLQAVRAQIELYRCEHNHYPGTIAGVTFVESLTEQTLKDGSLAGDGDTEVYGPYLQTFPSNPMVSGDDADPDGVTVGNNPVESDEGNGWYFNEDTGKFYALHDLSL